MKTLKNKFTERGASLVLVVFMLVVLVSFGILALTSAAANVRLSNKTLSWRDDYYQLDAQASDIVFAADALLYDAELAARDAITGGENMETAFAQSYMSLARTALESFSYDGAEIVLKDVADRDDVFVLEITLESAEKSDLGQKHLTVQLAVQPPDYLFPTANIADVRRAENATRYTEVLWMQWQDDFDYEYSTTEELWDGIFHGEE